MSSIPPSLPPTPVLGNTAQPVTTATVISSPSAQIPAQILDLAINTIIDASNATAQSKGVVQVQTDAGSLTLKLPLPLPDGAKLALQVISTGANPQFRVLTVNGLPVLPGGQIIGAGLGNSLLPNLGPQGLAGALGNPTTLLNQNPPGARLPGLGQASPLATPLGNLGGTPGAAAAPNPGLVATVVRPADQGAFSGPPLPTGTQLTVRIATITPPSGVVASQSATNPLGNALDAPSLPNLLTGQQARQAYGVAANASPQATNPTSSDPQNVAAPLIGRTDSKPTNEPPVPPSEWTTGDPATPDSANLPRSLSGVVAPNSHVGKPLLQTELGLLSLDTAIDLPAGTRVELETVSPPTVPDTAVAQAPARAAAPPIGIQASWPAFDEAVQTLRQSDTQAAQQLLQRLPTVGPQLGPTLLALASAVQSGTLRAWLGEEPIKALDKAGKKRLIENLESDLSEMRDSVRLPSSGNREWQAWMMPMAFGQQIERVRVVVRRPPGDEEETRQREEEGTRFLVDVEMSRLGPLQLDGLVKRRSKTFHLIIRSQQDLPEPMQSDINAIFMRALEGLDMAGSANFLKTAVFVEPQAMTTSPGPGVVI